jgi:DNA-binding transcriptional LysR family regulator
MGDRGGTSIDIQISRNPVIAEQHAKGEIDVALMEWWDERQAMSRASWRTEEMVVIVAPDHPWAGLPYLSCSQLREMPMLGGEPGTGTDGS